MEDFAVALVDEIKDPAHEREQFTVAYCVPEGEPSRPEARHLQA